MESYPSGKGQVCKTSMQRFDSARLLKGLLSGRPFLSERLGKAGSVLNIEAVRKGGLVFKKANCERTRFLYTHLHYQTLFSYNYLEANLL